MNITIPQQQSASGRVRVQVVDSKTQKVVQDTGWRPNMITNYGLTQVASLPWSELFVCCAAGDNGGVTTNRDVRFPDFQKDDGSWTGPAIAQRTGNSVTVSDELTSVNTGDTLVYPTTNEEFLIIAKAVGVGSCTLTLLNVDGSAVDAGSTTAGSLRYFIYRTTQTALFNEIKRAGRQSNSLTFANGSDPNGAYFGCSTDGPYTPGTGAQASATVSSGLVTAVPISNPGNGYTPYSPPVVTFTGGGAGKLIPGNLTGSASDGGQILSGGSGYDSVTLPQIQILGPGVGATFTVTVVAGVITNVEIVNDGDGYFADEYSTALGNLVVRDPLGLGSGASIVIKPRREAKAVARVNQSGAISEIKVTYPGYKLSSQPTVNIQSTSYLIHERTYNFTVETGLAQPRQYAEIGLSSSQNAGSNLFSRIVLRNPTTGLVAPVAVDNNQQLRVTYQLFVNFAPTQPVVRSSSKVGGWGKQNGKDCFEKRGHSSVAADGRTSWVDDAYHINEPYFISLGQINNIVYGWTPPNNVSGAGAFISDSGVAHSGSWGTQVPRDSGSWSFRQGNLSAAEYTTGNHYAVSRTKSAQWSVAAGNNVPTIRSIGTSMQYSSGNTLSLYGTGYSYVYDVDVSNQVTGKPTKSNTYTLTLNFKYSWGRRLTV